MTRINVIPVQSLTDQHLFAEFREITRVSKLARICEDAPDKYCLGAGHLKFFFNKGVYLAKRLKDLQDELDRRKTHNYTPKTYTPHTPDSLNKDWKPDRESKIVNLIRLHERLQFNVRLYRYYNRSVLPNFYIKQLEVLTR